MAGKLKIAGWIYLALALVWLGVQIPLRLVACKGAWTCAADLATAPGWALIWPVYWPLSGVFPRIATIAILVLTAPIAGAVLLVGAWHKWAQARFGT